MEAESQPRRRGRPATGQTPKRYLRVGPLWDRATEIAAQRGETVTALVTRALEREVRRCERETTRRGNTMIITALRTAGIDSDVTVAPDDLITVTGPGGVWAAIGYDGQDEQGKPWWTATLYTRDGGIALTESSVDLAMVASAVATWVSST